MSTGRLISKFLPVETQVSLLSELVQERKFDEVVGLLDATQLGSECLGDVANQVLEALQGNLEIISLEDGDFSTAETELRFLSQLIGKIDSLQELFESWICHVMIAYLEANGPRILPEEACRDLLFGFLRSEGKSHNRFNIVVLLEFFESACLSSSARLDLCNRELDAVLIGLLGCSDEVVALKSSNLMRWRISVITERCSTDKEFDQFCWSFVQQILASNDVSIGLSFLLRFLPISEFTDGLQEFVRKNEYWASIQAALNCDVQETRKIGLSVFKLTIKRIPDAAKPFSTQLFAWDPSKKANLIESWQVFTTLYEIVSLDTAMNQIEAASDDILKLFQDSNLHSTWGLLLFSTGLRAPMESVRKYMVALLLRIRVKSVFKKDLVNLRKVFLPSVMEAHFFNTDGKTCSYGERLTKFLSEMLSESGEDAPIVIKTMLRTLVDQGCSFDPARIYVSLGILDFLETEECLIITSEHLRLITKLFEFENEDAIFDITIQSIYLRYLLHVSPSVSAVEWIDCIVSHIKRKQNNYEIVAPFLSLYKDFAARQFTVEAARKGLEPLVGKDETTDFLVFLLFDYKDISISRKLLIEVARSGLDITQFKDDFQELLSRLIAVQDINSDAYESSSDLFLHSGLNFNPFKTTTLLPLLNSLKECFSGEKFKFFVELYNILTKTCINSYKLTWPQFLELYQLIKAETSDPTVTDFKVKDEIYGTFFDLLGHSLLTCTITVEVNELIILLNDNINRDNGNFKGDTGVAKLCVHILAHLTPQEETEESWSIVLRIFEILTTIWESFSCERLVLKQKNLHLATIDGLFHPTVLLYASSNSERGINLSKRVYLYGDKIVEQAFSRRGMLPSMSLNISSFLFKNNDMLKCADRNDGWLIDTMTKVFTCEQTSVNMFRLRTVIADQFNDTLSAQKEIKGLYERVYGEDEASTKIHVIGSLVRAPQQFKDRFITRNFHSSNLLSAIKRTDGAEEIQRLLKWQLILLCLSGANKGKLIPDIPELILDNLPNEISPIIRIYMEWTMALILSDNVTDEAVDNFTNKLFSLMDDHSRPIVVVSAERIIFLILKAWATSQSRRFDHLFAKFTSVLIPNATSSKPLVRHFSNSLMLLFWPSFQEFVKDPTFRTTMEGLYDKAVTSKMSGKYRAGDANVWDINADLTLTGIFGGVLKKTVDHDLPYILRNAFSKFLSTPVSIPIGEDETSKWLPKRTTKESDVEAQSSLSSNLSQLQTKSGAWESLMTLDNDGPSRDVKRSDLIVVSSLVDKPPNLGGICRLCDVLGVGLLTVQDIRVKNHPQFKNVAVTADKWMPIAEVPVREISNFMREKKREGYVLIGLEQTDKSVKLDTHYKFPRKSLILLGTEAHGIPGELLNQLDICLEIQQFGVIRSMNIQTATAVIVHSYTIQHM